MAHQDVVPVEETPDGEWTYEPWSGEIEEGKVWGRGAYDTKHTLVAILEAVEALLKASFKPKRTLLLSFGFDEELGGAKGGRLLAEKIIDVYPAGVAVIIDEGSVQFPMWDAEMAMIGTTEKDRMPLYIEIRTRGGHAFQPVPHTAIGIMSQIVVELESLQYHTYLSEGHPLLDFLICSQEHAKGFPHELETLLEQRLAGTIPSIDDDQFAIEFVNHSSFLQDAVKWSLTTAKSVNIFQGGIRGNSLPENVMTTSDVRIHIKETIRSTRKDISDIIRAVAQSHEMEFVDFDNPKPETPEQAILVSAGDIGEEPR